MEFLFGRYEATIRSVIAAVFAAASLLSSDRFHSWGALLGIMAFVEAGEMPAPEKSLLDRSEEVESR